jgi:hypothetical protein
MPRRYIFPFFCLAILIYLVFALFSIAEPPMGDSIYFLISSKVMNNKILQPHFFQQTGIYLGTWHPPLYLYILAFIDKLAGLNPINARTVGIFSVVIALVLIYIITQNIFPENKHRHFAGLIGVFLYAINPMVIQGSLLPDIDTTILAPLLLFFIYLFVKLSGKYRYLFLGLFLGLALWAKLTTPFLLIISIFLFHALGSNLKKGIQESSYVFFIGFGLFVISWGIYCFFMQKPFIFPFLNAKKAFFALNFISPRSSFKIINIDMVRALTRIILYTSPFYFLLFILACWQRFKEFIAAREKRGIDFVFILSLIILLGYLLVGGITHSFPKYHYPFLSLSAIVIAGFIWEKIKFEKKHLFLYLGAAMIICAYNIFLIGDFLYSTDYGLRENVITFGMITGGYAIKLAIQFILYILPFFCVSAVLLIKKANTMFYRALFVWTIASCFSLNILQAKADYQTVYCYGGKGTKEALSFLRKLKSEGKSILTTEDIYYNIDEKAFMASYDYCLSKKDYLGHEAFILAVKSKKPDCIVSSISSNTVEQYRSIFNNPKILDFLKGDFSRKGIGSYSIWIRKEKRG